MILVELIKDIADAEIVTIILNGGTVFKGTVFELLNNCGMPRYFNNIVINFYSIVSDTQDNSITKIFISSRKSDRELIHSIKLGMVRDSVDIDFKNLGEFFYAMGTTLYTLKRLGTISDSEYTYLIKFMHELF